MPLLRGWQGCTLCLLKFLYSAMFLLWGNQNIKNTQLLVLDCNSHLFLYHRWSFSRLCLVILPETRFACAQDSSSSSNMLSLFVPPFFVCCCCSSCLQGLTSPERLLGSSILFWVLTLAQSFEHRLNSRLVYVLESDDGARGVLKSIAESHSAEGNCLGMS